MPASLMIWSLLFSDPIEVLYMDMIGSMLLISQANMIIIACIF